MKKFSWVFCRRVFFFFTNKIPNCLNNRCGNSTDDWSDCTGNTGTNYPKLMLNCSTIREELFEEVLRKWCRCFRMRWRRNDWNYYRTTVAANKDSLSVRSDCKRDSVCRLDTTDKERMNFETYSNRTRRDKRERSFHQVESLVWFDSSLKNSKRMYSMMRRTRTTMTTRICHSVWQREPSAKSTSSMNSPTFLSDCLHYAKWTDTTFEGHKRNDKRNVHPQLSAWFLFRNSNAANATVYRSSSTDDSSAHPRDARPEQRRKRFDEQSPKKFSTYFFRFDQFEFQTFARPNDDRPVQTVFQQSQEKLPQLHWTSTTVQLRIAHRIPSAFCNDRRVEREARGVSSYRFDFFAVHWPTDPTFSCSMVRLNWWSENWRRRRRNETTVLIWDSPFRNKGTLVNDRVILSE